MQKTDSLLRTKLHQPFTSQKLVPRPRLQVRIAEGLRTNPLTLVIAPAGFGKTTLVVTSLLDCQVQAAWLSLDPEDNQIVRFLAYLIAALQSVDNTIGIEAAQIIAGTQTAITETILTSIINDLEMRDQDFVLILDDFQNITNREALAAVAFLLDNCPLSFHLLITTRSDPNLPLSRLRSRGQMVELRAADLRFTEDEAIQFLNDVMGLHLDHKAITILEEKTEGWIAGLQMAALSMHDREDIQGFIEGFSGTNRHILDFLLEEIMAVQSTEIQQFLLYTSILNRLSTSLCNAVLAFDKNNKTDEDDELASYDLSPRLSSSAALSHLERENLFLISLDDERTWFRYHHLFADLLRARLQQMQPGIIPLLHIRASAWLETNGFFTESIHHLIDALEYERAADLIERYGPASLEQSDPSVFQLADFLPQEILLNRPKIGLYQVWLLIIHGNIPKAIPLLIGLANHFSDKPYLPEQKWMQTIVATALAFLAPQSEGPDIFPLPIETSLDEIPAEESLLRNATDFLYGMALARKGRMEQALEISLKCIERERNHQDKTTIPTIASFVTRIYLMMGRLTACANLCHEYLDLMKKRGVSFIYTSGSMKIDLGEVMFEWNCLDEAEQYISEGLKGNEPWRNIMTDGFGLVALARVLQAKGEYSAALQAVEKLETVLRNQALPREFEEDFYTLRVRVQLASGDLPTASMWADQIQQSMDYMLHKDRYRLTLARIYFAQGNFKRVEELLTNSESTISPGSQTSRQIEFRLLLASALYENQRQPEALALIDSCLSLAEPEGFKRVFLDGEKPTRRLLTEYMNSDSPAHKSFAGRVLSEFSSNAISKTINVQSADLVEPLSNRELEVLGLIAQGQTNEEIAQNLFVARGTIKAHAASIYRKLGVANRTEAVSRARQLGILN